MKTIIYKSDTDGVKAVGYTYPMPTINTRDSNAFTSSATSTNATTPLVIRGATSGKTIYVTDLIISSQQATQAWLEDTDGTELTPRFYISAATPFIFSPNTPIAGTASKGISLQTSSAVNISAMAMGYEI